MKFYKLLLLSCLSVSLNAKDYTLYSPDGSLEISVKVDQSVFYSIKKDGINIISPSEIGLNINEKDIVRGSVDYRSIEQEKKGEILPVVPVKRDVIEDHYHLLRIKFRNKFDIEFRAYNEGVAYRFVTESNSRKKVIINEEIAEFNFAGDYQVYFPEEGSVFSHQERKYLDVRLSELNDQRFASTPLLVDMGISGKMLITEASLKDYPGMFLRGVNDKNALAGKFAHFPLEEKLYSDRNLRVEEYADYIAETDASRAYPWRVMIIANEDADLINSELVFKLSPEQEIEDTDWIKPGKVAWDWWNALNIRGVSFESGVNTNTYKYFIDFAADNDIEYIILDEGWSETTDITRVVPEIDMKALTAYAREKDVGIILWVLWNSFDNKLEEALDLYSSWGIKGVKVDFMQRDDQKMVNYYWKIAKKAAGHKLLVDFHGSYKPTGLRRAYPNVITREGLIGNEHCKWSADVTPDHNLTLPFIRMVAGPMDFTPGAMDNANPENFFPRFTRPMSIGTRCHQLGMYVIYESPLQMLCDNPTNYINESDCMQFLSSVPVTWDETIVLEAKLGDYLIIARRKGENWYIGGMNDLTPRGFSISLQFLGESDFILHSWEDGINAVRDARDYKYSRKKTDNAQNINIQLAPGGGYAAILRPVVK